MEGGRKVSSSSEELMDTSDETIEDSIFDSNTAMPISILDSRTSKDKPDSAQSDNFNRSCCE